MTIRLDIGETDDTNPDHYGPNDEHCTETENVYSSDRTDDRDDDAEYDATHPSLGSSQSIRRRERIRLYRSTIVGDIDLCRLCDCTSQPLPWSTSSPSEFSAEGDQRTMRVQYGRRIEYLESDKKKL